MEKARLLCEQPTQITEHRDVGEIVRVLKKRRRGDRDHGRRNPAGLPLKAAVPSAGERLLV
jgi:hypothetical protein